MRETLYLRLLSPDADATVAYCMARSDAVVSFTIARAPLETVLAHAAGRRVVAFIPATDVHLAALDLPARQRNKALQAAAFALEDQLANDVDELHFVAGARQDERWPIAAIARARLDDYLALFAKHGARADALVPDILALPMPQADQSVVLIDGQDVLVRSSTFEGFNCQRNDLTLCLQLADPEQRRELRVIVPRHQAFDLSTLGTRVEPVHGANDALEVLLQNYTPAQSINLLQGDYAPGQDWVKWVKPWRTSAALAITLLLAALGIKALQAHQLQAAVDAQRSANQTRYQQLFPAETRIVDLEAQLGQQLALLNSGTAQGGLLPLIHVTSELMSGVSGLSLQALQMREGALYVSFNAGSLEAVEQLKKWFETPRAARMEVQSANAGDRGVQIRIKLVAA